MSNLFDIPKKKKTRGIFIGSKELRQRGKSHTKRDSAFKALPSGKRLSANDKVYWETRKNRSDNVKERIANIKRKKKRK